MRLGVFGRLGRSVSHDGAPTYQAVIAGAFVDFLDKGYVYKGLKPVNWCIHDRTALAEAEVEYENHTSPSIWVRFALMSDPATIDPALAGTQGLRPDLDHHAMDDPGQHGDRLSSEVRVRRRRTWMATCTSLPRICCKPRRRTSAGTIRHVTRRFAGSKLEGAVFRHPFLERDSLGHPGRSRHARTGHRRCPHRSRPRPGRLRRRPAVRHRRRIARSMRRGASSTPRAPRPAARRTDRQDGLGSEPDRHRDPEGARRAARHREGRAQLSALLALPQADHLPRHRAVVHRHGAQRTPAERRWKPSATSSGCRPGAKSASTT